jgi:Flp pilus assembly protein TadG
MSKTALTSSVERRLTGKAHSAGMFFSGPAALVRRAWRKRSSDNGNVAIIFALAMPLVVGAGALSVETNLEYTAQTHLQVAADAAAYASALDNRASASLDTITTDATAAATSNGWSSATGTIQVHTPPTSGPNQTPTAAEVILSTTVPRYFTAYFNNAPLVIHARAVAVYTTAASACILALNKTASGAVTVQGSTTVNLVGCDVMSNSVASDAVKVWGSASLSTDCVVSAGGFSNNGGLTLTGCPSAVTQAPRARDPFAGLPTPPTGVSRTLPNMNPNSTTTLLPGNYSDMTLKGTVFLNPGVYYLSGGAFNVASNASITGTGVTIFMAAGTSVSMNGTSHVDLSAPTSGTYSGMLFFGDPAATSGANSFNGDNSSHLTGDLYFPHQSVSYSGNYSGANGCTQVVADTVQWTGSSTISVDCAAAGMTAIPARQAVKVVE